MIFPKEHICLRMSEGDQALPFVRFSLILLSLLPGPWESFHCDSFVLYMAPFGGGTFCGARSLVPITPCILPAVPSRLFHSPLLLNLGSFLPLGFIAQL